MAGLFKNKAIKAKLEGYEIPDFENKLNKVKVWHEAYENKSLHKKTESQCEQAFNQGFFVEILGYKGFPNETYTIDPKGSVDAGGQKPDAILGFFTEQKRRVIAVVEIKDVNTSLDKSQKREGSMSPVQQAFKYKPQYKECDFVIATNFFEIRLLKDNQLDFESFTLESLINPKDNYFEFRKFYYLLNAGNFIAQSGQTNTLKLLSEIRTEQEQITKDFYLKYKDLRQELIKNILKNNQQARLRESFYVLAVEKAQKIIDRLVFICFCEDLDLLPDDKLQEVIFHTEKLGLTIPIWEIMKNFFTAIDSGSPKLGIPDGYNGELFKEDEALNGLKIDDEICRKFVELGKYDFSEDLSVNILGHIFEQSISDLEELKNIAKKALEEPEATLKASKRKKDGIYYTPDYVVAYIVKNSLGKYLEEQEHMILEKHNVKTDLTDENYHKRMKTAYEEYQKVLRNVKILDPACGSGAFLVKVYDYLFAENKRVVAILTDISGGKDNLFNSENYIKSLLQNNIYGVDLNPESVEITKLSLWLKTARKGEKLVSLKNNIKCGNSLISDPAIAGERAFNWENEFPEIMNSGGFDVVVGNPPYVFGGNEGISRNEKSYYKNLYLSGAGKINLFTLFIEKSHSLLKNKGYLSFIIPNTFLRVTSYHNTRKFFLEKFSLIEILDLGSKVFQDAVTTAIAFIAKKENPDNNITKIVKAIDDGYSEIPQQNFVESNYLIMTNSNDSNDSLSKKITNDAILLGDICKEMIFGVVITKNKSEVVSENYIKGYKPFLEGKDMGEYLIKPIHQYINYEPKLLHRARSKEIFEVTEKILVQRITGGNKPLKAAYDNYGYYNKESINNIILNDDSGFNYKFILALLNSSLINWFYNTHFTNESKLTVNISKEYLSKIPIKKANNQELFTEHVDKIIAKKNEFQTLNLKIIKLLQQEFKLEGISSKVEKLYKLDFDGFIKALGIKKLDLQKKSELLDFFEKNRQELVQIKAKIDQEEQTINNMVFDLYGLTEEERKIVMESTL